MGWLGWEKFRNLTPVNGSAIRAFVNSAKTLRVRYSFSTGFHCSSANRLHKSDPNLGFHCVNRIFAGLARRGDPFSQPSGSSAFLADASGGLIRTERSGPDVSCPAPSGSVFLGQPFYYHTRWFWQARGVHQLCAHPATGGTRKLSVPGRVHSIPKSCGSQEAFLPPGSNPFLTRGTVESPAKRI